MSVYKFRSWESDPRSTPTEHTYYSLSSLFRVREELASQGHDLSPVRYNDTLPETRGEELAFLVAGLGSEDPPAKTIQLVGRKMESLIRDMSASTHYRL